MLLSYSWLKELTGFKLKPEKLADILSTHTAEVEKIIKLGQGLDKIVVGEIKEIKPLPKSKKLSLAKVQTKINKKVKELDIVCGAENIAVGQKVPLALTGAKILGEEIKEVSILGVKSQGMLCAEDELGIGEDHSGIYILPKETKIGEPVAKVLGLNDYILEIENSSLTHRPDLFNHFGLAREIMACLGQIKIKNFCLPAGKENLKLKVQNPKIKQLKIIVQDNKLCPRYMAVIIDGIKIAPSPLWMQNRLRNCGIRPINNVVDITNYVLLELGQPLHAFDLNNLEGTQIMVRPAKKGEKILALDGKEYELDKTDLIIADKIKPVALAGIMGGEYSGISEKTKTIVIESANFNPINIRQSSKRLGIRTESSLRFEKGLPLNFSQEGLYQAIELVKNLAQGQVVSQIFDIKSEEAKRRLAGSKKIFLNFEKLERVAGIKFSTKEVLSILKFLGFKTKEQKKGILVQAPIWRNDINIPEDIIEEIVRIYGINKIKPKPIVAEIKPVALSPEMNWENKLKDILAGAGFDEIYTYIFYQTPIETKVEHLELANPLNPSQRYLRISLLPNLEKSIEKNQRFFEKIKVFELSNVFYRKDNQIVEKKNLAGIIYGEKELFFKAKGVVEMICRACGVGRESLRFEFFSSDEMKEWIDLSKDGLEIEILIDNNILGIFGERKLEKYKIGFFELDFKVLVNYAKQIKKYEPASRYEPVKRDLAFLIDKNISCQKIEATIKSIDPLIKKVELFDIFTSERFGEKRNLAFHIIYQSNERTLVTEEVDVIQKKIIDSLEKNFKAILRDF